MNNDNNIILQPLREIGMEEKSQFWDAYDIQAALREAFRLGINPQSLAASPDGDDAENGDDADDVGVLRWRLARTAQTGTAILPPGRFEEQGTIPCGEDQIHFAFLI